MANTKQPDQGPRGLHQTVNPGEQDSKNPIQRLSTAISKRVESFGQVATRYLTAERLVKLAQVCIAKKPELADCSTISVLDSLMTCARLGLEPNEPGGCWLVPFKTVCTPIIDYRGLIDVCRRSGEIAAVHADIRYSNDKWEYAVDTTAANMVVLKHAPADGDRGTMLGAFFVAKLTSGQCQATYLSTEQIDKIRARSKADQKGFSPWKTDYPAMAIKSVCRRGVNLLPRTPEVQALREELQKEDDIDMVPIGTGDTYEANTEAIDRLLGVIRTEEEGGAAMADEVVAAFGQLSYGPAKQLQLLTQWNGDPKTLLKILQDAVAATKKPADDGKAAATSEVAKPTEAPKETQQKKNKGGRPKKQASETKPPKPETKVADRATNQAPAASKGPEPESVPAKKTYDGGSF